MKVFEAIDFKANPQATILVLMSLPGVIGGNLLLAFALPMASIAGYEYFVKKKVSIASIIISLIGFIILGIYHY
jgi:AGZA family xanthine/uracil permease-like MFS transporter